MPNPTNQAVPFEYESHQIRTLVIEAEPWFVAVDICKVLGILESNKALLKLDDDEKEKAPRIKFGVPGGSDVWMVNESGLYALIMRSNKPEAKAFRKWVTSEVLPTIRKQGAYVAPSLHTELQDAVEKAMAIAGSQAALGRHIDVSDATIINVKRGEWKLLSESMKLHVLSGCLRVIEHGITFDREAMEMLLQVPDADVRMGLYKKLRKTGVI